MKEKQLLIIVLLLGISLSGTAQKPRHRSHPMIPVKIIPAADRTSLYLNYLQGKNIGMVVNQTSVIGSTLTPSVDSLLKLGIPMGLSYFIEVTAFTLMAIFIARLGAVAVAGHQITANVGTVLYMLPLSLANATGTLVAQAIGARDWQTAKKISRAGIRLSAILSVLIGVAVWFAREQIIRAYTPDEVIIASALPLFLFIAFYQLFDSLQVTTACGGAMGDRTRRRLYPRP